MKKKKFLCLVLSVCLTASCLAGCSDKDGGEGTADPANYYNGKSWDTGYDWGNVEIVGGGFVPGIIYNETEEGLVYAKTDIGGAYKLNTETNRWECITDSFGGDDWNFNCIESIATDPVEPNRVYLSCGTSYGGNGCIMYSYDYGENWTKVDFDFNMGGNDWGRNCGERLAIDPNDNSIIYYASHSKGLFVSKDYGQTWNTVDSFPTKGSYGEGSYSYGILWVSMDKSSSDEGDATKTIFCGVADKENEKIYRSDDAGETWEAVANELSDDGKLKYFPVQGRVSSNGYLYATYSNFVTQEKNPSKGLVCRYNIKEKTWEDITPPCPGGHGYCGLSIYSGDMIAVTTICHWQTEDNIIVSRDGGNTWAGLWNLETEEKEYDLDISASQWLDWQGQLKLGWWTAGVAINPFNPDEILYGTGATIFGIKNATKMGSEKAQIEVRAMGIEETAIFDFYSPKDCGENTPDLYSIMGDIYGFRHDDATAAPQEHWGAQSFKADSLAVAANNPDIVVRTTSDSSNSINSICYSTDGSKTWKYVETIPDGVNPYAGGKAALSADGEVLLWYPGTTGTKVYRTENWGRTWTVAKGVTTVSNLVPDQVNPDKIYISSNGDFYVSTDKGKTFENFTSFLMSSFDIEACSDTEGDLWIAAGSVFLIENAGEEGSEVVRVSDQVNQADAIGLGKAEKDGEYMTIFIMGECNNEGYGIYRSTDKGKTWKRINDDSQKWGNVNKNISGDPKHFGRVYISTNGRGIIMGNPSEK